MKRNLLTSLVCVCLASGCASCGDNNSPQPEDAGGVDQGPVSDGGDAGPVDDGGGDEPDAEEGDLGGADSGDDVGPDMTQQEGYSDPTGASGTRLKRRYLEGDTGAYMTVDFYDTELETPCTFREAVDGTMRCMPPRDFTVQLSFADSGCTEPVYDASDYACDQGWARNWYTSEIYRRTDTPAVLSGDLYYVTSFSGECERLGPPSASADYFVAELMPSAQFVRGTVDAQSRADGMVARYLDGDDGSRLLHETVHQTRGYACDFEETGHCLPPSYQTRPGYLRYEDPGCTDPVYGFRGTEPPPIITNPGIDQPVCDREPTYYERGSVVTADPLYDVNDMGDCEAVTVFSNYTYYRQGPAIPLSEFPEASVALEGTGGIAARRYVDADGAPLGQVHEFWDASLDEGCDPMETPDGNVRCVSRDRGIVEWARYSDPACTESSRIGGASCVGAEPRILAESDARNCVLEGRRKLLGAYETGANIGDTYYFDNGSIDCEMRTAADHYEYYSRGPEVTDELPPLELKTEM
jgi:hypothetical protein